MDEASGREESSSYLFNCMNLKKICGGGGGRKSGSEDEEEGGPEREEGSSSKVGGRRRKKGEGGYSLRGGTDVQVDYKSNLVPRMREIINCQYYWGKIDRHEAEQLLEGQDEGSFLLRDSVQDEFIFSVSFRRYSRSLHARIEESKHKFSFDCHDPAAHTSTSVCKLLEQYKNPSNCMFFEPMLVKPLMRKHVFSLQDLARSIICDHSTYSSISLLPLPKSLKVYLREYHYNHKIAKRYLH